MKNVDDLIQIASAGGGLVIDANLLTTTDLIRVASYAAGKGSRVIMKGVSSMSVQDLEKIAHSGYGAVIFDFTQ